MKGGGSQRRWKNVDPAHLLFHPEARGTFDWMANELDEYLAIL